MGIEMQVFGVANSDSDIYFLPRPNFSYTGEGSKPKILKNFNMGVKMQVFGVTDFNSDIYFLSWPNFSHNGEGLNSKF